MRRGDSFSQRSRTLTSAAAHADEKHHTKIARLTVAAAAASEVFFMLARERFLALRVCQDLYRSQSGRLGLHKYRIVLAPDLL